MDFAENRENTGKFREVFGMERPFSPHFLGPKQCVTPQIPYSTEQGKISFDQGTIVARQGNHRFFQRITYALLDRGPARRHFIGGRFSSGPPTPVQVVVLRR
jgi:hypothetical protein